MKRNNFFTAALNPGLESNDGTVGVDAIHTQDTLQPKPGFGEDKGLAVQSDDDLKADKAYGEDHDIAKHDAIDAVAESQEHTLALEHLQATAMRFCRMAAALEEIAETAETNLEAGVPMDPAQVSMVTTAIDAAGVGEPMEEAVALEAFGFDATVATESFVEAIKERAEKVWAAVAKFFKKTRDLTVEKLKRFGDFFRNIVTVYEKLEKETILASNAGKPFQNSKWEKDVQGGFYSPASTKTPVAVVDGAKADFEQLMNLADSKLQAEMRALNNAWSSDKPEAVVAAMNKALALAHQLADIGDARFKHAGMSVEVNLPQRVTLDNTGGLEGTKCVFGEGLKQFTAGLKTASVADVKHLKESARQADRAIDTVINELFKGEMFDVKIKARFNYDAKEDDKVQRRKLLTKYVNLTRILTDLAAGAVIAGVTGFYHNHRAATRWVRFSVAEAKAAARETK